MKCGALTAGGRHSPDRYCSRKVGHMRVSLSVDGGSARTAMTVIVLGEGRKCL